MIDVTTQTPVEVLSGYGASDYLIVPLSQLNQVQKLFDANHVTYWVDEESLSIDGEPEVIFITLSLKNDSAQVQRLLDSVP